MRRGSRSRQPTTPAQAVTSPPTGGAYRPLSDAQRDLIVDHAFDLLASIGMAGAPERHTRLLEDAGATRRDDGRLCFSRTIVEAALQRAPSTVDLPGFVEDRGLTIGAKSVHIGTGGAAVRTLDAESGVYRESTLRDLWAMMRVVDACPNIHYGLRPLVARDIADDLALDLHTAYAVTHATAKPTGVSFTSAATVDPVVDLFDMALGSEGAFASQPFSMAVVVHVVPPMRFSPEGCEIMERAIARGMIIQTCSAGQAGATSPPSLAGSLAQGLAEIFAGIVLADTLSPGHPCIHAFMPFISDLRSGAMSGGGGEAAVASAAAAQLLGDLDIPHAVSAGITDSKHADNQAGYEKGYTVTLAAQAGADMVQLAVGMLGSIMVASPESLVIDDDMCGAILRAVRGVDVDPAFLDLDIVESVVSGDGHYLGHEQTLSLMRSEYVYPSLGDRRSVDEWLDAGSPTLWAEAQRRVADILAAGAAGHLSPKRGAAIQSAFGVELPKELS